MKSLYDEPAYYGMMFDQRADDVTFYRRIAVDLAKARGRSLELVEYGAGTGRVALELDRDGHRVHAVENAPAMVHALRERLLREPGDVANRVTVHDVDALHWKHETRADALFAPFNGLAHFESAAGLAAYFESVRAHLDGEGLFAMDVWLPSPPLLAGAETRSPWFADPRGSGRVRCTERFEYEPLSQVLVATLEIRDDRNALIDVLQTRLRQFFPEETRALLAHHGFEIVRRTSHFAPRHDSRREAEPGEMLAYICAIAR